MRKKVIRRDQYGRPYLDRARDGEGGCGASVLNHLRDGERLHVPLYLRDTADAWREDMHRQLTTTGTTDATIFINTSTPPMVVDAFGGTEGLSRPGARYLATGHKTVDHAVMITLAAMREEAYRAYDEEAQNAWRGTNRSAHALPTTDAEAAYQEYDEWCATQYLRGK